MRIRDMSMYEKYNNVIYNKQNNLYNSDAKVSSGLRINRASDDAAGLTISQKLRAQSNGLDIEMRIVADYMGVINSADSTMEEMTDIAHRLLELQIAAKSSTVGDLDRDILNGEASQLWAEFKKMGSSINPLAKELINKSMTRSSNKGVYDILDSVNRIYGGDKIPTKGDVAIQVYNIKDTQADIVLNFEDIKDLQNVNYMEIHCGERFLYETYSDFDKPFTVNGLKADTNYEIKIMYSNKDGRHFTETKSFRTSSAGGGGGGGGGVNPPIDPPPVDPPIDPPPIKPPGGGDNGLVVKPPPTTDDLVGSEWESYTKDLLGALVKGRAHLGAIYNRLEHMLGSFAESHVNTKEAESRIADSNIALEMAKSMKERVMLDSTLKLFQGVDIVSKTVLKLMDV